MQFILTSDWQPGINKLTDRLRTALTDGRNVLWLITGGSNIPAIVEIMKSLESDITKHLTILLSDERFGPVGHQNSNSAQLDMAGFKPKQATLLPILVDGLSLAATRAHYEAIALDAFRKADIIIGQFGIGSDGHIAGILPKSPAVRTPKFASAYKTPEFPRLTLTAHAIKRIAVAYAFVFGDSKDYMLDQLHDLLLPYSDQPSQVLRELPEAYVFNNHIGDPL